MFLLIMENISWFWNTCCCCTNYILKKRKKKFLTPEQIRAKALIMLEEWKVDQYANNRFLYKIPQEQIRKQLDIYIKDLTAYNLYL